MLLFHALPILYPTEGPGDNEARSRQQERDADELVDRYLEYRLLEFRIGDDKGGHVDVDPSLGFLPPQAYRDSEFRLDEPPRMEVTSGEDVPDTKEEITPDDDKELPFFILTPSTTYPTSSILPTNTTSSMPRKPGTDATASTSTSTSTSSTLDSANANAKTLDGTTSWIFTCNSVEEFDMWLADFDELKVPVLDIIANRGLYGYEDDDDDLWLEEWEGDGESDADVDKADGDEDVVHDHVMNFVDEEDEEEGDELLATGDATPAKEVSAPVSPSAEASGPNPNPNPNPTILPPPSVDVEYDAQSTNHAATTSGAPGADLSSHRKDDVSPTFSSSSPSSLSSSSSSLLDEDKVDGADEEMETVDEAFSDTNVTDESDDAEDAEKVDMDHNTRVPPPQIAHVIVNPVADWDSRALRSNRYVQATVEGEASFEALWAVTHDWFKARRSKVWVIYYEHEGMGGFYTLKAVEDGGEMLRNIILAFEARADAERMADNVSAYFTEGTPQVMEMYAPDLCKEGVELNAHVHLELAGSALLPPELTVLSTDLMRAVKLSQSSLEAMDEVGRESKDLFTSAQRENSPMEKTESPRRSSIQRRPRNLSTHVQPMSLAETLDRAIMRPQDLYMCVYDHGLVRVWAETASFTEASRLEFEEEFEDEKDGDKKDGQRATGNNMSGALSSLETSDTSETEGDADDDGEKESSPSPSSRLAADVAKLFGTSSPEKEREEEESVRTVRMQALRRVRMRARSRLPGQTSAIRDLSFAPRPDAANPRPVSLQDLLRRGAKEDSMRDRIARRAAARGVSSVLGEGVLPRLLPKPTWPPPPSQKHAFRMWALQQGVILEEQEPAEKRATPPPVVVGLDEGDILTKVGVNEGHVSSSLMDDNSLDDDLEDLMRGVFLTSDGREVEVGWSGRGSGGTMQLGAAISMGKGLDSRSVVVAQDVIFVGSASDWVQEYDGEDSDEDDDSDDDDGDVLAT